jgi:very-short-patch-repair endonuclease
LTKRSILFVTEYRIGPYLVDIAFPDRMLAVEADGSYWHGRPKQQAKDRRKDEYATSHGWTIIRLGEVAIRADVAACVDVIAETLRGFPPSPVAEDDRLA